MPVEVHVHAPGRLQQLVERHGGAVEPVEVAVEPRPHVSRYAFCSMMLGSLVKDSPEPGTEVMNEKSAPVANGGSM